MITSVYLKLNAEFYFEVYGVKDASCSCSCGCGLSYYIPYSHVIPLHENMVNLQNGKYSFSAYEIRQRLQPMNPILQKLLAHFGLQRDRLFEQ